MFFPKVVFVLIALILFTNSTLAIERSPDTLIISNSKAWKPYSYLDENNQPAGILIDYWRAYGVANDVEVQFKLVDWQSSLDLVKNNQADVHAGLLWSKTRANYLEFGSEIFEIDTQLYFHSGLQSFNVNSFLMGGHNYKVGVVSGSYEVEFLQTNYPNVELTLYDNNSKLLQAAFSHQIRAFVADLQVANYYLYTSSNTSEFIGVKHLYSGALYFAVAKSKAATLDVLIPNFRKISADERQRILSRWMHIETVYPEHLLPIIGIMIMLGVFVYILLLRYTVNTRTNELANANRELKVLSETDALTGLSNRRYFLEKLEKYRHTDGYLAIIVIDIDDFKTINDTFGHVQGDKVIKSVASSIRSLLRSNCVIARIGGEEFALVYVYQGFEYSYQLSQNICRSIRELEVKDIGSQSVTVSVGCAVYEDASECETLYEADRLMYVAKKQGKNRAVVELISSQAKRMSTIDK
ncbi:putative diguanylate cyclase AdrA [Vibrio mediterranei]|uniref:sensor domain-containing diguanylate cyclase n=1 Tax=Vibrio mediterranei TaxID=689 RepID=UPI0007F54770|nr:sensor domain-containing diguanylate cyclase [Vibrio mediterranei]SBO08501.1 putative diguanylate cyclase AdrA [Vibrio mediterranei]